jgi:hypothetical protein
MSKRTTKEAVVCILGKGEKFRFGGPRYWNQTFLGQTCLSVNYYLVYNDKIEGPFSKEGHHFYFIKESFPENPTKEFWIVDLFNNHDFAWIDLETLTSNLELRIKKGEVDLHNLMSVASQYATEQTSQIFQKVLSRCTM